VPPDRVPDLVRSAGAVVGQFALGPLGLSEPLAGHEVAYDVRARARQWSSSSTMSVPWSRLETVYREVLGRR
jgi:hypothetical protein